MNGCKVLIVDDEQFVREHFEKHIPWTESGFSFMGAAVHGQQALQMMEKELPDIVLTDITMPVMDGISFAKTVKERWPEVEIIFLTAHDEFSYAQQAIGLGAKNYLLKVGLSKEKIIDACQQAVAEMLRSKKERTNEVELWNQKKVLIDAWLHHQSLSYLETDLESILHLQDQYYVYGSIICDMNDQTKTDQERVIETLQGSIANKIENWTTEKVTDAKIVAFPLGDLHLIVQLSIPQRFGMNVMQQLVHQFQHGIVQEIEQLFHVGTSVYLSSIGASIYERHSKFTLALRKAEQNFYVTELDQMGSRFELTEYSRVQQLEQVAKLTKMLGQKDWTAFLDEVNGLTTLQTPLHSPLYLWNVAKMVLDHMVDIPAEVFHEFSFRLKKIIHWEQYCDWWRRLIEQLSIPLQLFHDKKNVRKEIQQLCERIVLNFNEDLSIRMLADEMQMNSAYLGQLFKQETGEYLSDYITKVRIEKAKELLQKSDLKIYQVSQEVGIEDYRYFCKMFKERVGTTPTAYKRSIL